MDVSIWAAFLAGVLSFFAPCILPLVPVYMGYMAGESTKSSSHILRTLLFIGGFTAVFAGIGALAGKFGFYTLNRMPWLTILAGVIVALAGVTMLLRAFNKNSESLLSRMGNSFRNTGSRLATSAHSWNGNKYLYWIAPLFMGAALAIAWTPCIGPVLGGILTLAYDEATVMRGSFLLTIYSLGLGVPFLLSAVFVKRIASLRKINKYSKHIQVFSGMFLVVFGLVIATGSLAIINSSLYRYWPF